MLASLRTTGQELNISGTVLDSKNDPVVGATVVIKGTAIGTTTGINGDYNIAAPPDATLVFALVGMAAHEEAVSGRGRVDVVLSEGEQAIDEVIVVGYGVQRKRDLTGSISHLKGDNVKNVPSAGLTTAMVGKVAGVDFVTSKEGGAPGASPAMRIRGTGTFNSSDPLWVVDGVVGGMLVNPNDVESIEVLKDASASAIYGTRAANGVVLVTTKKGRNGEKVNVSVNAYTGVSNLAKRIDLLTAPEVAMLRQEAYTINNSTNTDYWDFWNNPYFATQRTDWQDAYFGTGKISNIDLSIKGGSDKSTFFTSFGYYKDKGMISPASYERYNVLLKSDHNINKRLKFGQNFQYALSKGTVQQGSVRDVLHYSPAIPARNEDGTFGGVNENGGSSDYLGDINNPILNSQNGQDESTLTHRLRGNVTLDIELAPGLFIKGNYGASADVTKGRVFYPFISGNQRYPRATKDVGLRRTYEDGYGLLGETYATWFKEFGQHTVNLSGGYTAEKWAWGETFSATSTGYVDESFDQLTLNNGLTNGKPGGDFKAESALSSWFGRAFYSFDNKYLLTLTGRADGSSKFPKGNRWGFFPAFSAGWRITEESFMSGVDFLSNLKLTGGWGSLGNQSIGDFQYLSTIAKGAGSYFDYNFGGIQTSGSSLSKLGNQVITWERTNMTNLALEAGFLKNRLNATITYFNKNTEGMLLPTVEVGTMGTLEIPPSNIGEVNNHGVELKFSYADRTAGDFTYSANLNFTFIRNKVTKLYGGEFDKTRYIAGAEYGTGRLVIARTFAGDPMGSFYGHKTNGIYQNLTEIATDPYLRNETQDKRDGIQPGDVRFVDINNDGKVDDKDRVNLGDPNPDAIIGFNGNLGYKGFDLSFNVTANLGFEIYNGTRMDGLSSIAAYNMYADQMGRWHGPGTSNTLPRMLVSGGANANDNYRVSDLFVENGNYLMLRNLTLGYTLPKNIVNKIGLGNLRVYVTGQNLFVVTNYSGFSPELGFSDQGRGVDVGNYPITRVFTGGITVDF
ncbi:SusC/RagA family TonB-linked outer membrane protein [Bacteroidia bacterium]|nr:SusC/RagA family TonB-linked outer membrane protein [Bacteroidia bacterium]